MADDPYTSLDDPEVLAFLERYTDEQIASGEAEKLEKQRVANESANNGSLKKSTTSVVTTKSLLPPTLAPSAPAPVHQLVTLTPTQPDIRVPGGNRNVVSRPDQIRSSNSRAPAVSAPSSTPSSKKRPYQDSKTKPIAFEDQHGKIDAMPKDGRMASTEEELDRAFAEVIEEVDLSLDPNQMAIINAALGGKNCFITGQAGTGKSRALKYMIKQLTAAGKLVYQVAHNGAAATNIGGVTIHWYCGLNGTSRPPYEVKNPEARERINNTDVLIIDEISTVDNHMLSGLDLLFRQIKKRMDCPFGGIQIIACGDFAQLKPIDDTKRRARDHLKHNPGVAAGSSSVPPHGGRDPKAVAEFAQYLEPVNAEITYCFMSKAWDSVCQEIFMLENIYRQTDPVYLKVLGEIRAGILSEETRQLLMSRMVSNVQIPGHDPCATGCQLPEDYVVLFPRREDVEEYNHTRLTSIKDDCGWVYQSLDRVINPKLQYMLSNFPVTEKIKLKVGARVMLKKNMNFKRGLVNGRCGRVIGFTELFVEQLSTKIFRPIEGCVIKQAVPVTTEKPVSPTYAVPDDLVAKLPEKYKPGSVCPKKIIETIPRNADERSAELGTKEKDLTDFDVISPQRAGLLRNSGFYPLPVVHFDNDEIIVLTPLEWSVDEMRKVSKKRRLEQEKEQELDEPPGSTRQQVAIEKIKLASRVQLPVIYAWAISIHMSQGLTIPKLCVDLGRKLFEAGQAYVAVSRGQSLEGLLIRDLDFSEIKACLRVKAFYSVLQKKIASRNKQRELVKQP